MANKILLVHAIIIFCFVLFQKDANSAASKAPLPEVKPLKITILNLVDLAENLPRPEVSEVLRLQLSAAGNWIVSNYDSTVKRLNEYGMASNQVCNNPQCAFDMGNIMQSDFVLFGTIAPLPSVDGITLKILHIPSAKIVWTKVTENIYSPTGDRMLRFNKTFASVAKELKKLEFNLDKDKTSRLLAIVDLSENSVNSRVFFERVCTRVYGKAEYDLMSPAELAELFGALEINKYSVVPSHENMINLGEKLGVADLIYSRLYKEGNKYYYRLAMYDIREKSLILELPPQPSTDFVKLLDYERVFFNTLFSKERDKDSGEKTVIKGKKPNMALWVSLGLLGVGSGVAAYYMDDLSKAGNTGGQDDFDIKPPPSPPPLE